MTPKNQIPERYRGVERACLEFLIHLAEGRESVSGETFHGVHLDGWNCLEHDVASELMRIIAEEIALADGRLGVEVKANEEMYNSVTGWWPSRDDNGEWH